MPRIEYPDPHTYQRQILNEAARYNVLQCGRRFGKTMLGVMLAATPAIQGYPVGWFAPTYKLLAEPWADLNAMLAPIILRTNKQEQQIELTTGGTLDFWTLNDPSPDAGRGRKYKRAIIDEYSLVRALEEGWNAAIRPTLTDLQGDAWFLGTPKGRGYSHNLYLRGQHGERNWKSWRFRTVDNPHIKSEEVEEARASMPSAVFEQEYEGVPAEDRNNPFGIAAIAACVGELSDDEVVAWGVDLAKSQDWTVAIGLDEAGRVAAFERWQGPWNSTLDRLRALVGSTPALLDGTGVGDPIVESLQKDFPNIEGFKFTSASKQQLMERLAVAIHKQEVTFPAGVIQDELETFEYEYTRTGVRYTAPEGLHDDAVCALALALKAHDDCRVSVMVNQTVPERGKPDMWSSRSWMSDRRF